MKLTHTPKIYIVLYVKCISIIKEEFCEWRINVLTSSPV